MVVVLDCYSLIIRRDRLEAMFPGGWPQFLAEYGEPFEGWYDDDLVRFGAMNGMDLDWQLTHWRGRGLRLNKRRDGVQVCADMLVHAAPSAVGHAPCDWLEISDQGLAHFVGKKRTPRRPKIHSPWPAAAVSSTKAVLCNLLTVVPDDRTEVTLVNQDGRHARLTVDPDTSPCLLVRAMETGILQSFRLIEDLLNAGWVVE